MDHRALHKLAKLTRQRTQPATCADCWRIIAAGEARIRWTHSGAIQCVDCYRAWEALANCGIGATTPRTMPTWEIAHEYYDAMDRYELNPTATAELAAFERRYITNLRRTHNANTTRAKS